MQILTAVGVDPNYGIYPLAYALVESKNKQAWLWFLDCLGDDLELFKNSNFIFVTDRYCLKHIYDNMKLQWRGQQFKDLLWKCATATTVSYFNRNMEELKGANKEHYDWLKLIPPQHWARSHFSARPHYDVLLNNMCEVFEVIKKLAAQYTTTWNGGIFYQAVGPKGDQCVVNVEERTCSYRKWDLTGMPCKHAVRAIWNMAENGLEPCIPESWVHPSYWLATWEEMYRFKINPCNGPDLWPPSDSPIIYTPPEYHKPAGRPPKKRKKGVAELFDGLVKNGKMSRFGQTVTCFKCSQRGHNSKFCKGQRGATYPSTPTVNPSQTTQTTVNPSAPAVNPSKTTPTMRYTKTNASRYSPVKNTTSRASATTGPSGNGKRKAVE
ncbi:mutator type transposase [Tanacetum coccineum]|uniref:Mutator type transposase n=1 Tax=Tanacetum coccineum TaxID=301880 RepID=A0ABQ4YVV7_9ASTR